MDRWIAQFEAVKAALPGATNSTLNAQREESITQCREQGLPNTRDEAWKYTNVGPLSKHDFVFGTESTSDLLSKEDLADYRFADLKTHELVFVNGVFQAELSYSDSLPEGVSVESAKAHLERGENLTALPDSENVFVALNTAFMSDGAIVRVAKDTQLKQPIHLIFINAETDQSIMQYPRVDIVTEAHSEVTIIESYVAKGQAKHFTNALTSITAGENAQVEHYRIQDEATATYHIGNLFIDQQRNSRVVNHAISLGASLARVDTNVKLASENAEVVLNGLFMAQGRQHTDQQLRIDHISPHTRSDQFYKGVLDNASRGVFVGKVVVHEDAQKIESVQVNKNLLLSKKAEVDTKPELEIYADDVKCAHGATIGQLDDKELFYLQSRGIDEAKARSILTYAFADDVISRMRLEAIQQTLEKRVVGQLADEKIEDLKEVI